MSNADDTTNPRNAPQPDHTMKVRIPGATHAALKKLAEQEGRSMHREIVWLLRQKAMPAPICRRCRHPILVGEDGFGLCLCD